MKVYTSYYGNVQNLLNLGYKNLWAISGIVPNDFVSDRLGDTRRKVYRKLAPKYSWWKEWHDNNLSEEWYIEKYYETVLNKLDPNEVIRELKNDAILICYEKPGEFCHRRIVAKWLEEKLGIIVEEL